MYLYMIFILRNRPTQILEGSTVQSTDDKRLCNALDNIFNDICTLSIHQVIYMSNYHPL